MKKIDNQPSLFRVLDSTGRLKPVDNSNPPLLHQKAYSNAQSSIALAKHKASGFHITQKLRVKAFLFANQGSTLDEISAGTGIIQKSTICARFEDLRQDGFDLPNDHGRWNIRKREVK